MPRLTVTTIKSAKPGRHGDGGGLYLLVKPTGAKSWLLRVQADGRRRDVGLGAADVLPRVPGEVRPIDDVPLLHRRVLSLADAREKARQLRELAKAGRDPVVERDKDRQGVPTFEAAARAAHTALKDGWATKNAAAFLSTLEEHAFPKLGKLRVDRIEASDIRDMLAPIWLTIPVAAGKVRQRVGTVLSFAKSKGWRTSEPPGRSVTIGLPRQPKTGNFDAMPYSELPGFVSDMHSKAQTTGRQALLFLIFTAARPGEVRGASWGQIDLNRRDWTRPPDIMKGKDAHTVTLNAAAIALLQRLKGDRQPKPDELIFAGQRGAKLSDMTMNKVLRTAGLPHDAHAFRSSFRDWAAEKMPEIPDPVAEAALAHVVPDKVVRAYKRTNFLEMRRLLLESWGNWVSPKTSGDKA
jgi:integrase